MHTHTHLYTHIHIYFLYVTIMIKSLEFINLRGSWGNTGIVERRGRNDADIVLRSEILKKGLN